MNDPNWLSFQFPAKGVGGNGLDRLPKRGDWIPAIIRRDARSVTFNIISDFFVSDDPPHCRFEAMAECMKPDTLANDTESPDPFAKVFASVMSDLPEAIFRDVREQRTIGQGVEICLDLGNDGAMQRETPRAELGF